MHFHQLQKSKNEKKINLFMFMLMLVVVVVEGWEIFQLWLYIVKMCLNRFYYYSLTTKASFCFPLNAKRSQCNPLGIVESSARGRRPAVARRRHCFPFLHFLCV